MFSSARLKFLAITTLTICSVALLGQRAPDGMISRQKSSNDTAVEKSRIELESPNVLEQICHDLVSPVKVDI